MSVCANDRLLSAKDLQQILQCGKNRVYELIHSSGFPTIQIGSRFYVKQSALDHWLDLYTGRVFAI